MSLILWHLRIVVINVCYTDITGFIKVYEQKIVMTNLTQNTIFSTFQLSKKSNGMTNYIGSIKFDTEKEVES